MIVRIIGLVFLFIIRTREKSIADVIETDLLRLTSKKNIKTWKVQFQIAEISLRPKIFVWL